jgi:hypothetical protein
MATTTVPFGSILDKLAGDADLAVVLVSEASELLLVTDRRHLALLVGARDLAERLAIRHRELAATVRAMEVKSGFALLGIQP